MRARSPRASRLIFSNASIIPVGESPLSLAGGVIDAGSRLRCMCILLKVKHKFVMARSAPGRFTGYQALTVPVSKLGDLVSYKFTVDNSGEESGFVYVSRFRTVVRFERAEIERAEASKTANLFGFGLSGFGPGALPCPVQRGVHRGIGPNSADGEG